MRGAYPRASDVWEGRVRHPCYCEGLQEGWVRCPSVTVRAFRRVVLIRFLASLSDAVLSSPGTPQLVSPLCFLPFPRTSAKSHIGESPGFIFGCHS